MFDDQQALPLNVRIAFFQPLKNVLFERIARVWIRMGGVDNFLEYITRSRLHGVTGRRVDGAGYRLPR